MKAHVIDDGSRLRIESETEQEHKDLFNFAKRGHREGFYFAGSADTTDDFVLFLAPNDPLPKVKKTKKGK